MKAIKWLSIGLLITGVSLLSACSNMYSSSQDSQTASCASCKKKCCSESGQCPHKRQRTAMKQSTSTTTTTAQQNATTNAPSQTTTSTGTGTAY